MHHFSIQKASHGTKPTKQCISVPVYSWQRQNRWENNLTIPCCFILHLRVVVGQCLGTDLAQNWTFLSPVPWSWAAHFTFSVKNLFLWLSFFSFFFFWGGGSMHWVYWLCSPNKISVQKLLLCSLVSHLNTLEKLKPKMFKELMPSKG